MEDYKDNTDRMIRIKSKDDEIFRQAYLELKKSVEYAEANFKGFPMHRQLKQELNNYTPRFEQLASSSH